MRFRQSILHMLLVMFTLFVVHDLVIVEIDADTQVELCAVVHNHAELDTATSIHESIHHALDVVAFHDVLATRQTYAGSAYDYDLRVATRAEVSPDRPPIV